MRARQGTTNAAKLSVINTAGNHRDDATWRQPKGLAYNGDGYVVEGNTIQPF
jgi:hypothetical protein